MFKAEAHLVEIRQTAQIIASLMARNLGREWVDQDVFGQPIQFTSDFEGGDSLWVEKWNPSRRKTLCGDTSAEPSGDYDPPVAICGPDWVPTATSLELVDEWTGLLFGGLFQRWLAEERRLARFRAGQLARLERLKDNLIGATIRLHPCYEPLPNK